MGQRWDRLVAALSPVPSAPARALLLGEAQAGAEFAAGDLFTNLTGWVDSTAPFIWGGQTSYIIPETPISRTEALSVPAVKRARDLIAGTIGTLPISLFDKEHNRTDWPIVDQPEAGYPRSLTITLTAEDLLFEAESWWRVTEFGWHNYPVKAERIEGWRVSVNTRGEIRIDGDIVRDNEVIRFVSPNAGILISGARAIRTLLKLDAAAARYADEPMPLGWFTPAGDVDPASDTDITDMLDGWQVARQARATGYVPAAVKYQQAQMHTAEEMQLADSRNHAVLEIARLTGIDAEDLGVSTTSRTYFNAQDRDLQRLKYTLGPYVTAIEDRLSMGDVSQRGYYAKFRYEEFLRVDTKERYESYQLGLAVGALGKDEIRELEDKPPLSPGQRWTPPPTTTPTTNPAIQGAAQ